MVRPRSGGGVAVVGGPGVGVADDETYRRSGGEAFVYAGKDFDLVVLAPRGGARSTGAPPPHFRAQELLVEDYARGHTVDDTAYGGTVALAEVGEAEKAPEGIHLIP